jgi:hypothetical protein
MRREFYDWPSRADESGAALRLKIIDGEFTDVSDSASTAFIWHGTPISTVRDDRAGDFHMGEQRRSPLR